MFHKYYIYRSSSTIMKLASLDRIPFIMANSGYGLMLMSPLDPSQDKFKRWNPQEKVVKQALDLLDTHAYRRPRFFLNAAIEESPCKEGNN
jgi:hypothetical protein